MAPSARQMSSPRQFGVDCGFVRVAGIVYRVRHHTGAQTIQVAAPLQPRLPSRWKVDLSRSIDTSLVEPLLEKHRVISCVRSLRCHGRPRLSSVSLGAPISQDRISGGTVRVHNDAPTICDDQLTGGSRLASSCAKQPRKTSPIVPAGVPNVPAASHPRVVPISDEALRFR